MVRAVLADAARHAGGMVLFRLVPRRLAGVGGGLPGGTVCGLVFRLAHLAQILVHPLATDGLLRVRPGFGGQLFFGEALRKPPQQSGNFMRERPLEKKAS